MADDGTDYNAQLERRVEQFQYWLALARQRRAGTGESHCCLFFDEGPDSGKGLKRTKARARPLSLAGVANGLDWADAHWSYADYADYQASEREGDAEDKPKRFVQFLFEPGWSLLDLPNTTVTRHEAERILRDRSGFFWRKASPSFPCGCKSCLEFDPLAKVFLPGDERSAAEDAAFIFHEVWRFPLDWRLYVTCWSYEGPTYERDRPMD